MLKDLLVGNKKSEIQYIQPLLDEMDISGKCITADALHTIQDFGVYLKSKGTNYVFIAKGNKKKLIDRLKMLEIEKDYDDFDESVDNGHGRPEIRRVYLLSNLPFWLCFKTAEQAFVIERTTIYKKTGKKFTEKHFGLTSFTKQKAGASDIQGYIRGHWTIENKASDFSHGFSFLRHYFFV